MASRAKVITDARFQHKNINFGNEQNRLASQELTLRELTSSMLRFTNAVTLLIMQRMQSTLSGVTHSQSLIKRVCGALDAISNTLSTQIDASKKPEEYPKQVWDAQAKTRTD
jgi:hypothetical protein